jgi:hypothetical protein
MRGGLGPVAEAVALPLVSSHSRDLTMRPIALAAMAVTLSACTTQSMQHSVLTVADPKAMSTSRPYRSVAGETTNYQPVEPRPWVKSNGTATQEDGDE